MSDFKLKNKNIVITGGSGFIGSYLLESLLANNKICVIDNEYRGSNISETKKKHSKFVKNVIFEKSDVRDKNKILEVFKEFKPDIVFHLAGVAGVTTVMKNPLEVIDVNLTGSFNIAKILSKTNSVKKLIYASTSEVYGPTAYQIDEDSFTVQGPPNEPRWSYATSKLIGEHIFLALQRQFHVKVAIGRFFNIYGPKQIGGGAIHNFVENALKNKLLTVYDDGSQIRAWCFATDCVSALRLIAERGNGIYNIGNPSESLTSISLAKLVKNITKSNSKIHFKKLEYSDVRVRVPNIKKISRLGYKPHIHLEEGLRKTIQWYQKNN